MENIQTSTFYIKNMICERCIFAVNHIFTQAQYQVEVIQLGEIKVTYDKEAMPLPLVNEQLQQLGLEIIKKREKVLVEKVKNEIIKVVHHSNEVPKVNLADHLSQILKVPYKKLSTSFKCGQNMTIEKFFILQKIERAKALLQYDELSIKEIAYKLGYCSIQHLSNQFKAQTGISPRMYKVAGLNQRVALDKVGLRAEG